MCTLIPSLKCAFVLVWQLQWAATILFLIKVQPKLMHTAVKWISKEGESPSWLNYKWVFHSCSCLRWSWETLSSRIYLIMPHPSICLRGAGIKPYTCQVFIPFITWKDQRHLEDGEQWSLSGSSRENKHGRIRCGAPEQWSKANSWGEIIHSARVSSLGGVAHNWILNPYFFFFFTVRIQGKINQHKGLWESLITLSFCNCWG